MGNAKTRAQEQDVNYIKPQTSWLNIIVILTAGLSGFCFAYSNNAISGSLAQTSFAKKFLTGANASQIISGMIGAYNGGGFFGVVVQAPISDHFGRRIATGVGAINLVVSSALLAGSVNAGMFIAFRFFSGLGAGIVFSNAPVYMAEISPPHTRGLLVGSHAWAITVGLIISSLAALGFNFVTQDYQWRLQFIMLTFFSCCLLVSVIFIPESPRWLIENDKHDQAWKVLESLHKSTHDPQGNIARAELLQIQSQILEDKALPSTWMHILRTPSLRRRAYLSYLVWIMGNSTGTIVIVNFLPSILGTLGFGQVQQFGLSIVFMSISMFGATANIYLMDRVGRVKFLAGGAFGCAVVLLIEALLQRQYLGTSNEAGLKAATAMIFIFIAVYGCTVEGAAYVYITEIWPTYLRSKGATIGFASFFLNSIAYATPASEAFGTLGWKYYMIFFAMTISCGILIALYFPETKGLTLEEINVKFGDHVDPVIENIYDGTAQLDLKQGEEKFEHLEVSEPTDNGMASQVPAKD